MAVDGYLALAAPRCAPEVRWIGGGEVADAQAAQEVGTFPTQTSFDGLVPDPLFRSLYHAGIRCQGAVPWTCQLPHCYALAGQPPVTSGGVVAQVWRGGRGRQVQVARLLAGTDIGVVDDSLGRRAGMLLARSGHADAIDATVVCLAADGDDILTADPGDLLSLAQVAEIHIGLIPV
ncbi:MAG TPA: hypothetical protein VLW50_18595 [Streptosporangiaceae bacterium]|nr:hypothetical protein [Streptosporangiaceae bacterium]